MLFVNSVPVFFINYSSFCRISAFIRGKCGLRKGFQATHEKIRIQQTDVSAVKKKPAEQAIVRRNVAGQKIMRLPRRLDNGIGRKTAFR